MSSRSGGREWIAVDYLGKGIVHAWMSGAYMVLGKDADWLPAPFRVTEKRWNHVDYAEIPEHVFLLPTRLYPFDARYKTSAHYLINSSMFPTIDTLHIGCFPCTTSEMYTGVTLHCHNHRWIDECITCRHRLVCSFSASLRHQPFPPSTSLSFF